MGISWKASHWSIVIIFLVQVSLPAMAAPAGKKRQVKTKVSAPVKETEVAPNDQAPAPNPVIKPAALAPAMAEPESSIPPFFRDIPGELISPWTTDARLWLVIGSGATLAAALLRDSVTERWQASIARDAPLGSSTRFGDKGGKLYPQFGYLGLMLGHWAFTGSKNSLRRAEVMFKATAYAGGIANLMKEVIHQPRPNTRLDLKSFPSGHATVAFAFSSVIAAEHGFFPLGLIATLGAGFVGFSRMNDNKHYLHDVLAGATIGSVYGLGVSYFSQARRKMGPRGEAQAETASFDIVPLFSRDIKGAVASWQF